MTKPSPPTIRIRTDNLELARAAAGLDTTPALARAMRMHSTTVSRTLSGQAELSAAFIAGLLAVFPRLGFSDLFAVETTQPEALSA